MRGLVLIGRFENGFDFLGGHAAGEHFALEFGFVHFMPIVYTDDKGAKTPVTLSEDKDADGEQRFISIGVDATGRLLVVIFSYRGEEIRLISARPATVKERESYES